MLQLQNETPFAATMAVFPDRAAIDTLYVVVKATVSLRPRIALAPEQLAPVLADVYYGDPGETSLRLASEMHIGKVGTDVIVVGHARAPGGSATREMIVSVTVADRQKASVG